MFRLVLMLLTTLCTALVCANEIGVHIEPALGRAAPTEFNTVISADGDGLPAGRGSVSEGRKVYASNCSACHGEDGRQVGNQLVGGQGSLATSRPLKTVGSYWPYATTLYDYIAKAMPYNAEKSLSVNEVYAVSAYLLYLNAILDEHAELNQSNLAGVKMPNRDGFIELSTPIK